jgi:hypothetical protein
MKTFPTNNRKNISYKQQGKHFLQTTRKTFPTNNRKNISYKQQGKHFLQTTRKTFPTNNMGNISYKQQGKTLPTNNLFVGYVFLVVCRICFSCCL